jgi:hypothetical protein
MMLPCSHTTLSIRWLLVKKQMFKHPAYSFDVAPHYIFFCVFHVWRSPVNSLILINLNICRMWGNYERPCIKLFPRCAVRHGRGVITSICSSSFELGRCPHLLKVCDTLLQNQSVT